MDPKPCAPAIEPDATIEELIVVAWVKAHCIGHPGDQLPGSGCPDQSYIRAQIASLKLEGYQEGVMYAFDHILRPLVYESSTRESVHLETIHKLAH